MRWFVLALSLLLFLPHAQAYQTPKNLDKAIIAEDTCGDLEVYRNIVSCVRNRLVNGQDHGLVAMKRKNFNAFVQKEYDYVLNMKGIDLEIQAKRAIYEVFVSNKDYCDGATNYEHTGVYPIPAYTKNMRVVKILYQGTKREITFWRKK